MWSSLRILPVRNLVSQRRLNITRRWSKPGPRRHNRRRSRDCDGRDRRGTDRRGRRRIRRSSRRTKRERAPGTVRGPEPGTGQGSSPECPCSRNRDCGGTGRRRTTDDRRCTRCNHRSSPEPGREPSRRTQPERYLRNRNNRRGAAHAPQHPRHRSKPPSKQRCTFLILQPLHVRLSTQRTRKTLS